MVIELYSIVGKVCEALCLRIMQFDHIHEIFSSQNLLSC